MAVTLRINSIPGYIQEGEFKNIFSQVAECLSCNLVKGGPNGELVGYARFATPNAASRAMQMYQGWQGFGNTDGLRITPVSEDQAPAVKRVREDAGRDDSAIKQSRVMGAGNLAYSAGGQFSGYQQDAGRQAEAYNPMQPNGASGNQTGGANNFGAAAQVNPQFARQTGAGQQDFQAGAAGNVDLRSLAAANPSGSRPMTQNYFAGGTGRETAVSGGPGPQANGQNTGGAPQAAFASTGVPNQNLPQQMQNQGMLQPGMVQQQQPQYQQPQGVAQQAVPQMNVPYNPQQQQQPVQQQGNFGAFMQNDAYDPQKPQLEGLQQQLGNQLQQQNPQNNSVASLAAVLGPLLQQGGLQSLQGILAGQNQNMPVQQQQQQQPQQLPAPQMNVMDQRPPVQMPNQIPPGNLQMRPQSMPAPQGQPFQPPMEILPHDAVPTLYVDGMALDVTKREMSHIFRPFEGFKEMRMVEKKDKNGNPLLIAFAEFETPHQAAASMKVLQDYPLDMSVPHENRLRLSYAKPLKSSDPRARGGPRPYQPPGGGDHFRGPNRDRSGLQDDRRGGDRRGGDRDRDRRGSRDDRIRTGGADRKK